MSKIEGIERLEGRGITAKVTDSGNQFTIYNAFSEEIGYPDATETFTKGGYGKRERLADIIDETFAVLARGKHERRPYGYVYVIESSGGERFLVGEHGLDITNPEAPKDIARLDRMDYGELIEYADEVNRAVRRKAYAEGYEQGKFDQRMETEVDELVKNPPMPYVSPQEKRDRIVAQAKADVDGWGYVVYDYVVNKEKRTVVALERDSNSEKVVAKGIAKCAPEDCFNAHIGKAIALRRALDLEVPDEYIHAPQPTEVRLGNVVQSTNDSYPAWGNGKVIRIEKPCFTRIYFVEDKSFAFLEEAKIIDDSDSGMQ